jgi:hypothetical protein
MLRPHKSVADLDARATTAGDCTFSLVFPITDFAVDRAGVFVAGHVTNQVTRAWFTIVGCRHSDFTALHLFTSTTAFRTCACIRPVRHFTVNWTRLVLTSFCLDHYLFAWNSTMGSLDFDAALTDFLTRPTFRVAWAPTLPFVNLAIDWARDHLAIGLLNFLSFTVSTAMVLLSLDGAHALCFTRSTVLGALAPSLP